MHSAMAERVLRVAQPALGFWPSGMRHGEGRLVPAFRQHWLEAPNKEPIPQVLAHDKGVDHVHGHRPARGSQ